MDNRREHLRLLGIFHFVYAGLVLLGSFVPIIWLTLAGLWWPELASELDAEGAPVLLTGSVGVAVATVGVIIAWTWAAALAVAGRSLIGQQRHTFCLVVAAAACLAFPVGTLLGVSTLVIINRNEVRELFA